MPLVAHNDLPTFDKLAAEGIKILKPNVATQQDIRELHIGLLNMMPDAALGATERQFFRLVGESNPIAQIFVHPFSLKDLPRDESARAYINDYYETFDEVREQGLDGLIITGANVIGARLSEESFWHELIEVADWAHENVTSTLCSCLATHAVLEFRYGQRRIPRATKKWGVFEHKIISPGHPLVSEVNSRFDVPHSRWNSVKAEQFKQAGLRILVTTDDGSVHLATSADGFRTVFFQGHPEYDTISLLKECKRDVKAFVDGELECYPPMPENYFGDFEAAVFQEYRLLIGQHEDDIIPPFPEAIVSRRLNNTWRDTARAVVGKWVGLIYQLTHKDRRKPFMDALDIHNPLNL